jgi:hypothetical protein
MILLINAAWFLVIVVAALAPFFIAGAVITWVCMSLGRPLPGWLRKEADKRDPPKDRWARTSPRKEG